MFWCRVQKPPGAEQPAKGQPLQAHLARFRSHMKGFSTTRARRWTQAQLQAGDAGDEQQAMEEHGPLGARSEAPGAHVARLVNVSCPGTQNVLAVL